MPSQVRARAVRWVDDEPFPGWVEVHLDLADGTVAVLCDKPPIFTAGDRLRPDSAYPVSLWLDCEVNGDEHRGAEPATLTVTLKHTADKSGNATFQVHRQDVTVSA